MDVIAFPKMMLSSWSAVSHEQITTFDKLWGLFLKASHAEIFNIKMFGYRWKP